VTPHEIANGDTGGTPLVNHGHGGPVALRPCQCPHRGIPPPGQRIPADLPRFLAQTPLPGVRAGGQVAHPGRRGAPLPEFEGIAAQDPVFHSTVPEGLTDSVT
jgi:hypothetical protein